MERDRRDRRGLRTPGLPDASGPHIPLATLPGMRERTLRVSSAGKTFSCTGWKVGWVSGPARLVSAVLRVKQFLTFVNAGPLQPAIAIALASARRILRRLHGTAPARNATCSPPASPTPVSASSFRKAPTSSRPTSVHCSRDDPDSTDGVRLLPRTAGALRRGRDPDPGLLRPTRAWPPADPVRLLQEGRGADRGRRAPAGPSFSGPARPRRCRRRSASRPTRRTPRP